MTRRLLRRIFLVVALLAACGETLPDVTPSVGDGGPDASFDATTEPIPIVDAGPDVDPACLVTDDASIYDQTFEDPVPCRGWAPTLATLAFGPPRCGQTSCRLCPAGNGEGRINESLVIGRGPGRYTMTAWVRHEGDGGLWGMRFESAPNDGGLSYIIVDRGGPLAAEYAPATATFVMDAGFERIRMAFFTQENDPRCYLIDDLRITYEP